MSAPLNPEGNQLDWRSGAWRIEIHESIPSTQELLKSRLREGLDVDRVVLRASKQTAGLGRRGKSWSGQAGGSYQSVALKDPDGRLRRPWTSLAVAVGVAEELKAAGAQVSVKWPNDLYLDGRHSGGKGKVGGVLSEHLRSHLVIGVGVNVANDVPSGAARLTGWSLAEVNDAVLRGLARGLRELVVEGSSEVCGNPELSARYAELDLLAGAEVVVLTPQGEATGVASGVDHNGLLVLDGVSGTVRVPVGTVLSWRRRGKGTLPSDAP